MKKGMMFSFVFAIALLSLAGVSAAACDLSISMINQDPYPAVPGDYVKIVFQVDGVANPECGKITFELLEQYPLIFDPTLNPKVEVNAGTYSKDFSSFLIAPYKVRVDKDALNGETPIEVQYKFGTNVGYETQQFDLNIEDTLADFEIFVKDYDVVTKTITLEILNTGESDIQALTLEIPKQENIEIKGSKINIVGDLDSNDYTTADFEAIPQRGLFTVKISYTDTTNTRRVLEKAVMFEPEYFEGRVADEKKSNFGNYLIWIIIIGGAGYYFYRRYKKKKLKKRK